MAGLAAAEDAGAGAPAGTSRPAAAPGCAATGAGPAKPVTRSSSKRSRKALEGAEAAAAATVEAPASRRRQRRAGSPARTAGKAAAEQDAAGAADGAACATAAEAPAARRRRKAAKQAGPAGEDGDTDAAQERAAGEADEEEPGQGGGTAGDAGSGGQPGSDAEEQQGGEEGDSEGLPELDAFDTGTRSAVEAFTAAATPAALLRPSPDLAALARQVAKARHEVVFPCLRAWAQAHAAWPALCWPGATVQLGEGLCYSVVALSQQARVRACLRTPQLLNQILTRWPACMRRRCMRTPRLLPQCLRERLAPRLQSLQRSCWWMALTQSRCCPRWGAPAHGCRNVAV